MLPASTDLPKMNASPPVGGRSPVSIFMVVVFPHPFEPTKPKISPRGMVKETSSTAVKSPKRLVRPFASMAVPSWEDAAGGAEKDRWPVRISSGRSAM